MLLRPCLESPLQRQLPPHPVILKQMEFLSLQVHLVLKTPRISRTRLTTRFEVRGLTSGESIPNVLTVPRQWPRKHRIILTGLNLLRCVPPVTPLLLLLVLRLRRFMLATPCMQCIPHFRRARQWNNILKATVGWVRFKRVLLQIAGLYIHTFIRGVRSGINNLPPSLKAPQTASRRLTIPHTRPTGIVKPAQNSNTCFTPNWPTPSAGLPPLATRPALWHEINSPILRN